MRLLLLLLLITLSNAQEIFKETVDAPRQFSHMSDRSIAVDSQGRVHIVYGDDHLYHAWYDSGAWHSEVVDSTDGTGYEAAIAITSNDIIHVSYIQRSEYKSYDLKHATVSTTGGCAYIETLTQEKWITSTSIAVDSDGKPHICYTNWLENPRMLYYTTRTDSGWITRSVNSSVSTDTKCSIAIDHDKKAHISFSDYDTRHLLHATNRSGSWTTEVIGNDIKSSDNTSIAIDSSGAVHISYCYRDSSGNLHIGYAKKSSPTSSWSAGSAGDFSQRVGSYNSIAVTDSTVAISYFSVSDGALKLLTKSGSATNVHILDANGSATGYYTSITADGSGDFHISYYSNARDELREAFYSSANPLYISTVDHYLQAGEYSDIVATDDGAVHISYSRTDGTLAYAKQNSRWNNWSQRGLGTIEGAQANSIAIAPNGNFHISYYDSVHKKLKYISKASSFLILKDIDTFTSSVYSNKNFIYTDSDNVATVTYNAVDASDTNPHRDIKSAKDASGGFSPQTEAADISSMGGGKAIDSSDHIHICYVENNALKIKTVSASTSEVIQTSGVFNCAMVTDTHDRLHVVFTDFNDQSMKYAYKVGSTWQIETILNDRPNEYAISVDRMGKLHLVYSVHGFNTTHLYYLSNSAGGWQKSLIDDAAKSAAITLGSDDTVHISYYAINMGDLKHAWFKVKRPATTAVIMYLLQ